jgi:hypothetical protein
MAEENRLSKKETQCGLTNSMERDISGSLDQEIPWLYGPQEFNTIRLYFELVEQGTHPRNTLFS